MKIVLLLSCFVFTLLSCIAPRNIYDQGEDWKLHLIMDRVDYETVLDFEENCSIEYDRLDVRVRRSPLHLQSYNDTLVIHRFRQHFTPIYAEYFFDERDSLLTLARLEWINHKYGKYVGGGRPVEDDDDKVDSFDLEYERIKLHLINHLEMPTSQDYKPQLVPKTYGKGSEVRISKKYYNYERKTVWDFKELYVELTMKIQSFRSYIKLDYYWKETAAAILEREK